MAVPAASTLIQLEDTRNTELTIKVTGYQWGWQYDYLDNGVVLLLAPRARQRRGAPPRLGHRPQHVEHYLLNVDNPLVVPAGTKVRLLITAHGRHPRLVGAGLRHEERRHSRAS